MGSPEGHRPDRRPPPAGDLDVPRLLARFRHLHRAIEVGLLEGTAAEMNDRLTSGELDAAFCLRNDDPPPHLAIEHLGADEIVAVFSIEQAPPTRTVALTELASLHLIGIRRGSALTSALEKRLDAVGLRLRLALESGDPFLLRSLAARGFAVAILPRSITSLEGPRSRSAAFGLGSSCRSCSRGEGARTAVRPRGRSSTSSSKRCADRRSVGVRRSSDSCGGEVVASPMGRARIRT